MEGRRSRRELKEKHTGRLNEIDLGRYQLGGIDERLEKYVKGVRDNPDDHNLYEVLAVLKFLRLMDEYT